MEFWMCLLALVVVVIGFVLVWIGQVLREIVSVLRKLLVDTRSLTDIAIVLWKQQVTMDADLEVRRKLLRRLGGGDDGQV